MSIRDSIIEDYAERYQTGKDLWSGEPLGFEAEMEVEIEFRESYEHIKEVIEVKPDPVEEERDEIAEADWDSMEHPQDALDFCDQNL